jgi:DNA-binding protein YbaB
VISLTVDPEVAGDIEMLQDLVVAALNEALDRSREVAATRMQSVAAGLGLPPGLI